MIFSSITIYLFIYFFNFFNHPFFLCWSLFAGKLTINGPQAFIELASKGEREREREGFLCDCGIDTVQLLTRQSTFLWREDWKGKTVHCISVFPFLISQTNTVLSKGLLHFIQPHNPQYRLKTTWQPTPTSTIHTYIITLWPPSPTTTWIHWLRHQQYLIIKKLTQTHIFLIPTNKSRY